MTDNKLDPALIELINRVEWMSPEEFYSRVISAVYHHVPQVGTPLMLYNRDVDGALISFRIYKQSREAGFTEHIGARIPEAIYHAACFVCAAYRALRTLERIQAKALSGPKGRGIAELLRMVRRREACFREELKPLRHAIEHIDEESVKPENMAFFNMANDRLFVATEKVYKGPSVDVNEAAQRLGNTRDEVMRALENAYLDPRSRK